MSSAVLDEKVGLSSEEDDDDGLIHVVHVQCHDTLPRPDFVTAFCGMVLDWDERRDGDQPDRTDCPDCDAADICPACNTPKRRIPHG